MYLYISSITTMRYVVRGRKVGGSIHGAKGLKEIKENQLCNTMKLCREGKIKK
jgi:hypothetical protein